MANDTVILSPCYNDTVRIEAPADAALETGVFAEFTATGVDAATVAVASQRLITVENIATAQGLDYTYSIGENCFLAAPPSGCLVNMKAIDATYAAGDVLEIGAGGHLAALSAGVAVAVVPSFGGATITAGLSLAVMIL